MPNTDKRKKYLYRRIKKGVMQNHYSYRELSESEIKSLTNKYWVDDLPSPTKEDKKHAHRYWSNICECGHGRPLPKPKVKKECKFKNCTCAYDHIHEYRACNKWCQTGVQSPTKEVEKKTDFDRGYEKAIEEISVLGLEHIKKTFTDHFKPSTKEVEGWEIAFKEKLAEINNRAYDAKKSGYCGGCNTYAQELEALTIVVKSLLSESRKEVEEKIRDEEKWICEREKDRYLAKYQVWHRRMYGCKKKLSK